MHSRFHLPDWNELSASDDRTPPLLGLPIDLDQWCNALPADLRQNLHNMQTPADVLPAPTRGGARPADGAAPPPAAGQTWGIER